MKTITNTFNFYRIDYFSKRQNLYTYKIVKAKSYDEAIKKSRIKNIEEITLVSKEDPLVSTKK